VRQADGTEALYPPRLHGLRTIILAGYGASITSEAIRWAAREQVAIYLAERSGEGFALLTSSPQIDGRRKALAMAARQWRIMLDPKRRLELARKIVAAKLGTLGLHPADAREFRQDLTRAKALDDILTCEARSGAAFFMQFRDARLKIDADAPAHWLYFAARSSHLIKGKGGVSKARHASQPWGAALNYSYTIACGNCARALIGIGADPRIGALHSIKAGRLSGAYDLLELFRSRHTMLVFTHMRRTAWRCEDFETDVHGIVRLAPHTARAIATLTLKAVLCEGGEVAVEV
jgi:CRISPR-associated endonuclease Cas1